MVQGTSWRRALRIVVAVCGALSVCSVVAGQSSPPGALDRSAANRGELTFKTYCASCHGAQARGDGPLAKDLKVQPANLSELSKRNEGIFPFEMVIKTIDHGRSVRGHGTEDMPAWGDAFEMTSQNEAEAKAKMTELAHFLWSIQVEP
jgi:mono/diheme cytochrome c family protein